MNGRNEKLNEKQNKQGKKHECLNRGEKCSIRMSNRKMAENKSKVEKKE